MEKLPENEDKNHLQNLIKHCIEITMGYPIAVCSFIRQRKAGLRNYQDIRKLVREDLFEYFDRTLFTK